MSKSTLLQIKKKVRRLTASPSTNQLSESDLEEYIDVFYEQDFPAALKLWNTHNKYEFFTIPNEDQYPFDTDAYQAALPPVYFDGIQGFYSQSRDEFFSIYPKLNIEQNTGSGDGSAGPYSFTLNQLPVLKRAVTVYATATDGSTMSASDVPDDPASATGTWIDNVTGSALAGAINYVTGVCTISFTTAIASTESIMAKFSPYTGSRPSALLFFKNYFILRPVPDKVYRVSIEVYQTPSQLMSASNHSDANTPDVKQWWQYVALGAAIKILEDRQDIESIQNIMPAFRHQEALILYRTATQQGPERTATIYTNQTGGSFNGHGFGAV